MNRERSNSLNIDLIQTSVDKLDKQRELEWGRAKNLEKARRAPQLSESELAERRAADIALSNKILADRAIIAKHEENTKAEVAERRKARALEEEDEDDDYGGAKSRRRARKQKKSKRRQSIKTQSPHQTKTLIFTGRD